MRAFNGEDANRLSSLSSSSTSSSYSPSPFSTNKTMEEVWKDINLSSLHHHSSRGSSAAGINLQDFLARPFAKEPPPPPTADAEPQPPPTTLLNLNSIVPDLHFLQPRMGSVSGTTFEALASAPAGVNANGLTMKRFLNSSDNSGDRRNKRMIKNRESAARSRARKQAYTNQLEQEVSHLVEENSRLKKQLQQLYVAPAAPLRKKRTLYRTSTAPF